MITPPVVAATSPATSAAERSTARAYPRDRIDSDFLARVLRDDAPRPGEPGGRDAARSVAGSDTGSGFDADAIRRQIEGIDDRRSRPRPTQPGFMALGAAQR